MKSVNFATIWQFLILSILLLPVDITFLPCRFASVDITASFSITDPI